MSVPWLILDTVFFPSSQAEINSINLTEELENKLINEVSNAYIYNLAISCELYIKMNPPICAYCYFP